MKKIIATFSSSGGFALGKRIVTDLAIESAEILMNSSETKTREIEGVRVREQRFGEGGPEISITTVEVENEIGAKTIGKPIGRYVTLESSELKTGGSAVGEEISALLARELSILFFNNLPKRAEAEKLPDILVVGLGNWNVTPDALGPRVVSKILVTRHCAPGLALPAGRRLRPVSVISPGVMGITGLETFDIIKGIVGRTSPDLIVAVDALAARSVCRVNTTIQLADTGINPGAGMGNNRAALNLDNLGVPVIAIGVPTVIDAATLINDSIDLVIDSVMEELPEGGDFFNILKELQQEEKYMILKSVLEPYNGNMFVTPKEVDEVVERLAGIIASAVNIAAQPELTKEEIKWIR